MVSAKMPVAPHCRTKIQGAEIGRFRGGDGWVLGWGWVGLGIRGWRRVGSGICKVGGVGSRSCVLQ